MAFLLKSEHIKYIYIIVIQMFSNKSTSAVKRIQHIMIAKYSGAKITKCNESNVFNNSKKL